MSVYSRPRFVISAPTGDGRQVFASTPWGAMCRLPSAKGRRLSWSGFMPSIVTRKTLIPTLIGSVVSCGARRTPYLAVAAGTIEQYRLVIMTVPAATTTNAVVGARAEPSQPGG